MIVWILLGLCFVCAVVPAGLFVANLKLFVAPPMADGAARVAVLIPARNEAANIAEALGCVLASRDVELEVVVLDDASTDATAAIVAGVMERDSRVRLVQSAVLPAGWNGKQHACWQLAQSAAAPVMLFLDADVRVAPDAVARMAAFQRVSGAALVSGFPRLVCVGFLEKLLLPLIHFVLLGFLPLARMRATSDPAFSAGCGQFLMCDREAYFASGGHEALRASMHDGLKLPRAFRAAGYRTDLADITELASVRMYDSAAKVWMGLAKNATEGMATPGRIVPISLVLLCGQVLPSMLLFGLVVVVTLVRVVVMGELTWAKMHGLGGVMVMAVVIFIAFVASMLPRILAVRRFRQPWISAVLHPVGIVVLLVLQWYALGRQVLGRPVGWRAREYGSSTAGEV